MCIPYIESQKSCHGNIPQNLEIGHVFIGQLDPENLPLESNCVSLAIIQPKLQPIKRQSQLQQIAPQNWLPWQRPSLPMDPHPTHDSYGPSELTTQTASLSVQPSLHRRPQSVPILYNETTILPKKFAPSHGGNLDPYLIHGLSLIHI